MMHHRGGWGRSAGAGGAACMPRPLTLLLLVSFLLACSPSLSSASKLRDEVRARKDALVEQVGVMKGGMDQFVKVSSALSRLWMDTDAADDGSIVGMPAINFDNARFVSESLEEHVLRATVNTCGDGKQYYNKSMHDTCLGNFCTVERAVCGDKILNSPDVRTVFSTNWTNCNIEIIQCRIADRVMNFDIPSEYGVNNCKTTNDAFACIPGSGNTYSCYMRQMTCSNYTSFGFFSWGLQCAEDQVVCNGTAVPREHLNHFYPNIVNGECTLNKVACQRSDFSVPCTLYEMNCGLQSDLGQTPAGCNATRFNVPCAQQDSKYSNCNIFEVSCDGVVQKATSPIPSQSTKCFVHSVSCDQQTIVIGQQNCLPSEMVCSENVTTSYSAYSGALSDCIINDLTCSSSSSACTSLQFACPSAPKCALNNLPCVMQCEREINMSMCACPQDLEGNWCESRTPLVCDISIDSPQPACVPTTLRDPKDYLLSADRKCYVFDDSNADVSIGYRVSCHYAHPKPPDMFDFTYWASNGNLSFTKPIDWMLELKIVNFNQLSDLNATFMSPHFSPTQAFGEELVWFNFSLGDIPDRYWFSRRLYLEAARYDRGRVAGKTRSRSFIDAPNRPISTARMHKTDTFTIVLVLSILSVFLGLVGYVGYKYYRSYRKTHPKKKM